MALQLNITTTPIGAAFATAYAKIATPNGFSGDKDNIDVNVEIYATAAARQANMAPIMRESFQFPMPTNAAYATAAPANILPYLYSLLKTLPNFAGAVDC